MTIEDIHSAFLDRPEIKAAIKELKRGGETHLLLSGLHASARALAIEAMARSSEYRVQSQELKVKSQESRVFFVIIDNEEDAKYLYADLVQVQSQELKVKSQESRVKSQAYSFFHPVSADAQLTKRWSSNAQSAWQHWKVESQEWKVESQEWKVKRR